MTYIILDPIKHSTPCNTLQLKYYRGAAVMTSKKCKTYVKNIPDLSLFYFRKPETKFNLFSIIDHFNTITTNLYNILIKHNIIDIFISVTILKSLLH